MTLMTVWPEVLFFSTQPTLFKVNSPRGETVLQILSTYSCSYTNVNANGKQQVCLLRTQYYYNGEAMPNWYVVNYRVTLYEVR